MDVTPLVPKGRQLIEAYGEGGFRISGTRYQGSVWVLPQVTLAWPVAQFADFAPETIEDLLAQSSQRVGILLIGTGRSMLPLPRALRQLCQEAGIAVEPMDTGAACRTYNVLLTEERAVAAALIAV
jgi:uncharacterized protein